MAVLGEGSQPVVLAAERVSKSFGEIQVLFSVDFDVRRGEVHALMGENGAGKSTLVKILSGFEQPTSGKILLDGQPVALPANGSAESLGRHTTSSVVKAIFMVVVMDGVFAMFFAAMGI